MKQLLFLFFHYFTVIFFVETKSIVDINRLSSSPSFMFKMILDIFLFILKKIFIDRKKGGR